MALEPITVETDNGTLSFTPTGELAETLENQTPTNKQKLIEHIIRRLEGDIQDLVRYGFANQEALDSVLYPDDYDPGAFVGLAGGESLPH